MIGTFLGLVSYMSDANTPATELDKSNVREYPNPVKPDYNGVIAVDGLTLNAEVKITTVTGQLVYSGRANGGLFTWVELPDYINTNEMAKQCLARNVAYVPGDGFFPEAGHNNCIRLNYSCMPEEKIEQGMTILGEVIKENIKK